MLIEYGEFIVTCITWNWEQVIQKQKNIPFFFFLLLLYNTLDDIQALQLNAIVRIF